MKLVINGKNVTINASVYGKQDKAATQQFLHDMAYYLGMAAKYLERDGCEYMAKQANRLCDGITRGLRASGFYKD